MPAARMVNTVCVASNSPMPNHMAAIHSQRDEEAPVVTLLSMSKSYFSGAAKIQQMQPITLAMQGTE